MKTLFNRRHALRALASIALPVASLGMGMGTGTALAAAGPVGRTRPPVPVLMTLSNGFTLPSELSAGWIPFEVTTPDVVSGGFLHYLQGFQIREGVAVEQVVDAFRLALSSSASDRIVGFQALLRDAELVGGAAADFATPVTATLPLAAGTYYFIDLNDFFVPGQTVNVQRVRVTGTFEGRARRALRAQLEAGRGVAKLRRGGRERRPASDLPRVTAAAHDEGLAKCAHLRHDRPR